MNGLCAGKVGHLRMIAGKEKTTLLHSTAYTYTMQSIPRQTFQLGNLLTSGSVDHGRHSFSFTGLSPLGFTTRFLSRLSPFHEAAIS